MLCTRLKKETGSPGDAVIATGLQNGAVKLWELQKQSLIVTLRFVVVGYTVFVEVSGVPC